MREIRILYVTKLANSMTNGVTVAVSQLLNSIWKYAQVGWLDLGAEFFDIDESVERVSVETWEAFAPDIVVIEDPFCSVIFCKLAAEMRKRGIPYVIVPHGCFHRVALQRKSVKKYIAIHTLFRNYLKGCAATQYLCEDEKDNSLKYGKSILVPNGIPTADAYKEVEKIRRIIFISRKDVRTKGIDYLLEALSLKKKLLEENYVKIELYGKQYEADERFISNYIEQNGLSKIVSNNGPVFGQEKAAALLNADLFILTSRHEGFPMSILEALSYGLPVLITRGTNMKDIIDQAHAGWTCETSSADIADKLEEAVLCADCSQISQNARNLSKQYSWDSIAEMTVKEYVQIIEGK